MLSKVVTKGSAPSVYLYPDPTNNRLGSGYQWDANGNMTARTTTPTMNLTYDVENRMVQATHSLNGTERYVYDPANQRVWKQEPSRTLATDPRHQRDRYDRTVVKQLRGPSGGGMPK